MGAAHTRCPTLRVQIGSTCSGAWPEIVQDCVDPKTGERWVREIGRTETAFVERQRRGMPGTYNEKPERFKPTDESAESIANAHLFAAAHDLLAVAQEMYGLLLEGKVRLDGEGQGGVWTLPDRFHAAIQRATTITEMKGGD